MRLFVEVAVTADVIDKAIIIRRGKRVRIPDALIAATALQTASVLITRNIDDFADIAGLTVINPEKV
jgi:predicted nucleic acid-binding protein